MVGNIDRVAFQFPNPTLNAMDKPIEELSTAIKTRATEVGLAAMTRFAIAAGRRRSIFS